MLNVSVQEAQNKLPELIKLAEQGEDVFILGENEFRIQLVFSSEKTKKRVFGQHRGLATMSDDFDEPLSDNFWLGNNENPS